MEALKKSLTNQTPSEATIGNIEMLRAQAKDLGTAIIGACPESRETSLALTHLEEVVMWAVKGLVLHQDED